MIRRYSGPRTSRPAGPARAARAATKSRGLTTMPSPPAPVSSLPPRGGRGDAAASSARSTAPCAGRGEQRRVRRARAGRERSRCQAWSRSSVHRALGGEHLERRELQVVERRRPASSTAGTRRRTRSTPRAPVAASAEQLVDVGTPRAAAARARRAPRGSAARAAAPTAAYWLRSSSCAFADHGSSSQSRQQPVGPELVPEPGRGHRRARRGEQPPRARVVEERPAGAGVDDAGLAARRRTARAAAVRVAADHDDRPRAHVLLLAHDPVDALARGSRRTPRRGARAGPARCDVATGAMVGGR